MHDWMGTLKTRVAGNAGFLLLISASVVWLSGCSAIASSAGTSLAGNLTTAMLDQEDPELIREAIPAYLLMLDSFVVGNPESEAMLAASAQLYAAYGAAFVEDPERAIILTSRARDYGTRSLCAAEKATCGINELNYDEFAEAVRKVNGKGANALYSYSLSSLAYIRANSADYVALADLPKVQLALEHLLEVGAGSNEADVYMYLGILNTLRPAALGGKPEVGRGNFEKAIELSDGENLAAKVEFARSYARLVYDRELHDQLLNEVLAAPVKVPGRTLFNVIAHDEAEQLMASADDYF